MQSFFARPLGRLYLPFPFQTYKFSPHYQATDKCRFIFKYVERVIVSYQLSLNIMPTLLIQCAQVYINLNHYVKCRALLSLKLALLTLQLAIYQHARPKKLINKHKKALIVSLACLHTPQLYHINCRPFSTKIKNRPLHRSKTAAHTDFLLLWMKNRQKGNSFNSFLLEIKSRAL